VYYGKVDPEKIYEEKNKKRAKNEPKG